MRAPTSSPFSSNCIFINLPKRDELLFRGVLALPKDSRSGFVARIRPSTPLPDSSAPGRPWPVPATPGFERRPREISGLAARSARVDRSRTRAPPAEPAFCSAPELTAEATWPEASPAATVETKPRRFISLTFTSPESRTHAAGIVTAPRRLHQRSRPSLPALSVTP